MRIDLHSHTTRSDGLLSPRALVEKAREHGVDVLAVTDHDTVSGIEEAASHARGLKLVPGIEITAGLHGREVHVLGHFVDPGSAGLISFCEAMLEARRRRIERMVERLRAEGLPITLSLVEEQAQGDSLGRPHVARALWQAGVVAHMQQAFDRWLTRGRPGWVERERPEAAEAIRLIHDSGGTASLAHPGVDGVSKQELRGLAAAGLDAVEAHHPSHPPSQVEAYVRRAVELGLLVTGGSDFHGHGGDAPLGTVRAPEHAFRALEARAGTRRTG